MVTHAEWKMSHRDCQRGYLCPITVEPGRQTFKYVTACWVFTWRSCKVDRHPWDRFTLFCCSRAANVAGLGLSLQICDLRYDMCLIFTLMSKSENGCSCSFYFVFILLKAIYSDISHGSCSVEFAMWRFPTSCWVCWVCLSANTFKAFCYWNIPLFYSSCW